jgi:hypothetical protein
VSVPVNCPVCGKTVLAPEEAAGKSVACPGCGEAVAVPPFPMAIPVASESARPSTPPPVPGAHDRPPVPLWVRISLGIGVFVGVCAVFAFIGAASAPDEPGLAASRMARKVGAPLALLLIAAAELGLWLWRSRSASRDRGSGH